MPCQENIVVVLRARENHPDGVGSEETSAISDAIRDAHESASVVGRHVHVRHIETSQDETIQAHGAYQQHDAPQLTATNQGDQVETHGRAHEADCVGQFAHKAQLDFAISY